MEGNPHNLAILGERGIGKSSLLRKFQQIVRCDRSIYESTHHFSHSYSLAYQELVIPLRITLQSGLCLDGFANTLFLNFLMLTFLNSG
jgi:hypothetical protein